MLVRQGSPLLSARVDRPRVYRCATELGPQYGRPIGLPVGQGPTLPAARHGVWELPAGYGTTLLR
jgi:hypothetical protein